MIVTIIVITTIIMIIILIIVIMTVAVAGLLECLHLDAAAGSPPGDLQAITKYNVV